MKRKFLFVLLIFGLGIVAACGNGSETEQNEEELHMLEVEFNPPEKVEVNEPVELKAIVTYGDEAVTDASEMNFEYWESGNQDDSITVDAKNNGDGTYTVEVTFDRDGVFEIFAHTTAKDMHAMPKRSIIVGEGTIPEGDHDDHDDHDHGHTEGFSAHFMEPEEVTVNQEIPLTVHLHLGDETLQNAMVRYEIFNENNSEKRDWVDAEETVAGEYTAAYSFKEEGKYTIIVHVENEEDLHEHEEYVVEVNPV